MAFELFRLNRNSRLAMVTAMVFGAKVALTIVVLAEKASRTSFHGLVEFANATLTDWMLFIFAAYALLHYIGGYGVCSHRKTRGHGATSSTISISSRRSVTSIRSRSSRSGYISDRSFGSSGYYAGSEASSISFASATTSVVEHRSRISMPLERFLLGRNDYFEASLGMLEGNIGVHGIGGSQFLESGLLEQNWE